MSERQLALILFCFAVISVELAIACFYLSQIA